MIIGIKYLSIYPQLIHQFPNGLAVYRSNLMPAIPGQSACIGEPVGALEGLDDVFNGNPIYKLSCPADSSHVGLQTKDGILS